jgi:hypothetical protein
MEAYALAKILHEAVVRFPRAERPGLGADVERGCREVLGRLVEARMAEGGKTAALRAAAVDLEKLRFLVRLACDFRLMSVGQYEIATGTVDRIGRMIGGWLRWTGGDGGTGHDRS